MRPPASSVPGEQWVSKCGNVELRCGRWQDVLSDVTACDAVITDPPYSEDTHRGNATLPERFGCQGLDGYAWLTGSDVREIIRSWAPRCRGWMAAMTDDRLAYLWRTAMRKEGRYSFAPVPILQHRPRLGGDGPGSCFIHLQVSRPCRREFLSWGSLPGWYQANTEHGAAVNGAKPLALMQQIISDYSRPGDLIVDPFAGGGTTLLAAAIEGRRAIGAEMDPETYTKAVKRLSAGYTPRMFTDAPKPKQKTLL